MSAKYCLLGAYLHRIDPFLLDLSEYVSFLQIRWYGMAYLAGAALGYWILLWLARNSRTQLKPTEVGDFVLSLLIGAFVGGRTGFCFFYEWRLLGFLDQFPYWGVLALHQGGMSSHGGMIGCLIAGAWFAHSKGYRFLHLMDVATFAGSLGIVLGRIANFINGELYGRYCPRDSPIAVQFPQEVMTWRPSELAKLAPAADAVGISPTLWDKWLLGGDGYRDQIESALSQMIEAVQSGQFEVVQSMSEVLPTRYPSQLIQAVLEGVLVFAVLAALWVRPRKPGFLAAWWVILYAVARIAGEQYREPDAGIGFELLGLTRGQWLSLAMLGGGLLLLAYVASRDAPRMSGWLGPRGDDVDEVRDSRGRAS